MGTYIREPINGFTHLGGAILSFVGLLALVIKTTLTSASAIDLTAVIIFGISMILLYAASATYHLVMAPDKVIAFLRKLDHSMIFILIDHIRVVQPAVYLQSSAFSHRSV